jgi:hypothetical protein
VPLGVIAIVAASGRAPTARPSPAREGPSESRIAPVDARAARWMGVSRCSAPACHGGVGSDVGPANAYTTWMVRDPHARAFEVLGAESSRLIEERLAAGTTPTGAEADPRCLGCHVHPDEASSAHTPTFDRKDGICEGCHGPAERWLEPHSRWRGKSDREKADLGMNPLTDLALRTEVCARCHVGGPGRDVDHDLIAAGHPRLNFEFAADLANLPRHWDDAPERRAAPDFEARSWAIGRVASARAALALLARRAREADHRPWPEFAEYDCFGCHHDLAQPSWRRRAGRGGRPRWGTWSFALMDTQAVAELRSLMERLNPDPEAVERAAREAVGRLDVTIKARDARGLRELLRTLVRDGRALEDPDWDGVVQRYLAVAALMRALSDLGEPIDPEADAALGEMRRALDPPKGFASPRERGRLVPGPFGEALRRLDDRLGAPDGPHRPGG